MQEDYISILEEIRDILRLIADDQNKLIKSMKEIKEEQKRLIDEIRISNFVINNMITRSDTVN